MLLKVLSKYRERWATVEQYSSSQVSHSNMPISSVDFARFVDSETRVVKGIVGGGRGNIGVGPLGLYRNDIKTLDFSNVSSPHAKPEGHRPGSASRRFRDIPSYLRTKETAGCLPSGNGVLR